MRPNTREIALNGPKLKWNFSSEQCSQWVKFDIERDLVRGESASVCNKTSEIEDA